MKRLALFPGFFGEIISNSIKYPLDLLFVNAF